MTKKRGNGEGSISRRKDGTYMARYTVQTATGAKRKPSMGRYTKRGLGEAHEGDGGPGRRARLRRGQPEARRVSGPLAL